MKVLIFGDIYGRVGRKAFKKHFQQVYDTHTPDFVIVNPENCTSGRGPIEKHIKELDALGHIDIFTSGDHIFDNIDDISTYLDTPNGKLIRPANYFESDLVNIPGKGYKILEKNGYKLLVINLISNTFLRDHVYNPFLKVKEIIDAHKNENLSGIIIDFHKEVTSEGYGMALFLDGEASFIYGTHTHVQTNDETIFPNGTGLLSDVGMSGPRFASIGADFEQIKPRFLSGIQRGKIEQSLDPNYTVNGCIVEIDPQTMKCVSIEKIRITGKL